jgi:hypothetical protein
VLAAPALFQAAVRRCRLFWGPALGTQLFIRLPVVPYLAAVGTPAIPCQNLACLIRRNHALSVHCNQHSTTLNGRAIELGLLPAVPRFT